MVEAHAAAAATSVVYSYCVALSQPTDRPTDQDSGEEVAAQNTENPGWKKKDFSE